MHCVRRINSTVRMNIVQYGQTLSLEAFSLTEEKARADTFLVPKWCKQQLLYFRS